MKSSTLLIWLCNITIFLLIAGIIGGWFSGSPDDFNLNPAMGGLRWLGTRFWDAARSDEDPLPVPELADRGVQAVNQQYERIREQTSPDPVVASICPPGSWDTTSTTKLSLEQGQTIIAGIQQAAEDPATGYRDLMQLESFAGKPNCVWNEGTTKVYFYLGDAARSLVVRQIPDESNGSRLETQNRW